MAEARANDEVIDVVRTRRVEVVDEQGRVRATLGSGVDPEAVGLRIYDRRGSERISVINLPYGAVISLSHEGNPVAHIECADDIDEVMDPGTQIALFDGDADLVMRWWVGLDGEVIEEGRVADRPSASS